MFAVLFPLFSFPILLVLFVRMRQHDALDRRRAAVGHTMLDRQEERRRQRQLNKENWGKGLGSVKTVNGILMDPFRCEYYQIKKYNFSREQSMSMMYLEHSFILLPKNVLHFVSASAHHGNPDNVHVRLS